MLKKHYREKAKSIFFKKLYSSCSYLIDLVAICSSYLSLRNFYWIPLLFIFIFIETNLVRMFCKKKSIFRSSRSQKFFKIDVLKNFAIFTRKQLCWNLFLTKLQSLHQRYCWKNLWICSQNHITGFLQWTWHTVIANMRKQPLKLNLQNRCSDLCSLNPWKIPISCRLPAGSFTKNKLFHRYFSRLLTEDFNWQIWEQHIFKNTSSGYVWILYMQ